MKVALTTDFECYSPRTDGSQRVSIEFDMLAPGQRLASLATEFGIPLTFFIEIVQLWRFLQCDDHVKPANDVLEFLATAVSQGHEIQIHAHSEWLTAQYRNGRWYRAWRGPDRLHDRLNEFETVLDSMMQGPLRRLQPPAWCFRAGAYRIEPIAPLFGILKRHGIIADSSQHSAEISCSTQRLGGLIELPILGHFPTTPSRMRWDMNFSSVSTAHLFDKIRPTLLPSRGHAVMQGHTKLTHDWGSMSRLFRQLSEDDVVEAVGLSRLALQASTGSLEA